MVHREGVHLCVFTLCMGWLRGNHEYGVCWGGGGQKRKGETLWAVKTTPHIYQGQ